VVSPQPANLRLLPSSREVRAMVAPASRQAAT
jgi:hypothetical protein